MSEFNKGEGKFLLVLLTAITGCVVVFLGFAWLAQIATTHHSPWLWLLTIIWLLICAGLFLAILGLAVFWAALQ